VTNFGINPSHTKLINTKHQSIFCRYTNKLHVLLAFIATNELKRHALEMAIMKQHQNLFAFFISIKQFASIKHDS
jgi:hypothetical protein